jgi:hypothetical protein
VAHTDTRQASSLGDTKKNDSPPAAHISLGFIVRVRLSS